ncbi:MAG: hypothetical protein WC683_07705 [bacterium]|jgi:hypothetical protein
MNAAELAAVKQRATGEPGYPASLSGWLDDAAKDRHALLAHVAAQEAEIKRLREALGNVHHIAHHRPTKNILPEIHRITEPYHIYQDDPAAMGTKDHRGVVAWLNDGELAKAANHEQ